MCLKYVWGNGWTYTYIYLLISLWIKLLKYVLKSYIATTEILYLSQVVLNANLYGEEIEAFINTKTEQQKSQQGENEAQINTECLLFLNNIMHLEQAFTITKKSANLTAEAKIKVFEKNLDGEAQKRPAENRKKPLR